MAGKKNCSKAGNRNWRDSWLHCALCDAWVWRTKNSKCCATCAAPLVVNSSSGTAATKDTSTTKDTPNTAEAAKGWKHVI